MPVQEQENYRLLQDQSDVGSKESLSEAGLEPTQRPRFRSVLQLKAMKAMGNGFLLLLLFSGLVNVLLSSLLITRGKMCDKQVLREVCGKPTDASAYGLLSFNIIRG